MSGHSKWATIKHKKGAQDKARGKLFAKLIRQVEVAAREGGGDITANATLRTMYAKAREASVPLETIERAVKRGTGELEGVRYEAVSYEGYGPSGVAMIVECLTDNRNRTGADVRMALTRNGGSMAEPGSVAWQFERKGTLNLPKTLTEDEILSVALDAGAEDLVDQGEIWVLRCAPSDLVGLRAALDEAGIAVLDQELAMVPNTIVPVHDEAEARRLLRILDALDDQDDVQNVWANYDISDDIMENASV